MVLDPKPSPDPPRSFPSSKYEPHGGDHSPVASDDDDLYGRLKSLQRQLEFIDIQEEYVKDELKNLTIRAGTGNNIMPSFYFSLAIGGITGGSEYRWNIENCNTTMMHWGEPLVQEPGNMVGPTVQGAWALYNQDPNAYWDTSSKSVRGSAFGHSPRVFPIPLYDPAFYDSGKQQGRTADLKVANWIGFFLEDIQGNNIYGRITPIAGLIDKNAGPAPANAFPKAIRLVQ